MFAHSRAASNSICGLRRLQRACFLAHQSNSVPCALLRLVLTRQTIACSKVQRIPGASLAHATTAQVFRQGNWQGMLTSHNDTSCHTPTHAYPRRHIHISLYRHRDGLPQLTCVQMIHSQTSNTCSNIHITQAWGNSSFVPRLHIPWDRGYRLTVSDLYDCCGVALVDRVSFRKAFAPPQTHTNTHNLWPPELSL